MIQEVTLQKPLLHNILTILWWVSIWGLTELAIDYAVKHHIPSRFIFYIGLILLVGAAVYFDPDLRSSF